jgi:hypothetical protein
VMSIAFLVDDADPGRLVIESVAVGGASNG